MIKMTEKDLHVNKGSKMASELIPFLLNSANYNDALKNAVKVFVTAKDGEEKIKAKDTIMEAIKPLITYGEDKKQAFTSGYMLKWYDGERWTTSKPENKDCKALFISGSTAPYVHRRSCQCFAIAGKCPAACKGFNPQAHETDNIPYTYKRAFYFTVSAVMGMLVKEGSLK